MNKNMNRKPIKRGDNLSVKGQPEFFLIISPSREVCEYVSSLKKLVRDSIGHSFESDSSKAHISLLKYRDQHTESLLYRMEEIVSVWPPFNIYLKNLSVFDHGINKTIFLDIVNKTPVRDLAEELTGRKITPHITIAKNLVPKDFSLIWRNLRYVSCNYYFECNHITVLKNSDHRWSHHLDLRLMGIGIGT